MIHGSSTPVPKCGPEEAGEERSPDSSSRNPELRELPIEEDMDRCTIASPPPDFGLDEPTLRDPLVDVGADIQEGHRDTLPDPEEEVQADRPTPIEILTDLDTRHDTDPAPPPDSPEAE
jgi:hypothetical protein